MQKVVGKLRTDLIIQENRSTVQCLVEIWGQGQTELSSEVKITNCSGFKGEEKGQNCEHMLVGYGASKKL